MVCGPKAFGTSQRPAWPLDTSGGTALTWLPRAEAQPVLSKQSLTWATCLGPHKDSLRQAHSTDNETKARRGEVTFLMCRVGEFKPRPGARTCHHSWTQPGLHHPEHVLGPAPPAPQGPSAGMHPSRGPGICRPAGSPTAPHSGDPGNPPALGHLCGALGPRRPSQACAGKMQAAAGLHTERDPRSPVPGSGAPPAMRTVPWACAGTTCTVMGWT